MIYKAEKPAIIILQDGTYFEGIGVGATGKCIGELTFSTVPGSGYVECLTDPTYKDKIILFTYPSIGNYGVPAKEKDERGILNHFESSSIKAMGMVINEYCENPSHYESVKTLNEWLIEENVPGIQWIDTRMLTQQLVEENTINAILQVCEPDEKFNVKELKREIQDYEDQTQSNLVAKVSTKKLKKLIPSNPIGTVVIYDFGLKNNILRTLLSEKFEVIVVPYLYDYQKIMDLDPDGVLITNGPGDPNLLSFSIDTIKDLIKNSVPTLGIGMGNMLIGLAAGAKCYKMTAEHCGGRTTVENETNHCYITYQNHDYCLKDIDLKDFKELFHDKDDQTNEGLIHKSKPIFSVAFNPEGSPGALDVKEKIFNKFINSMEVK
ncbi:MAG: glutamine-hydrolyzing carbamoyl-phosphate synthase small subunit [Candidatus Lokiarchaeota archaeon]|nr:glutamine-hydrolyzing carbamoyl-phosphate synthase small subunit [Candidatus Lokiarchaeota archaeon]MBD3343329.1 glutamine-hydrolyzing carbamoyl-phosphate synthase small subunit [Candidatus Lokiarchaeota archaeon]